MTSFGSAADKFADVLKETIGIVVSPVKKITDAKADMYIEKLRAENKYKIEKVELIERAKMRLFETEVRRQYNLEEIGKKALELLPKDAKPEEVDIDWLHDFSTCAQDVSEPQLRLLWSRLLAQEATKPGYFSRRTLQILKNFNLGDCNMFIKLARHIINMKSNPESGAYFYKLKDVNSKIKTDELLHLEHINLIEMRDQLVISIKSNERSECCYWGKNFTLINKTNDLINVHVYYVTQVGIELLNIIEPQKDDDFYQNFKEYITKNNLTFVE